MKRSQSLRYQTATKTLSGNLRDRSVGLCKDRKLSSESSFWLYSASQSAMNTMHCLARIRFALVLRRKHFTLDDKVQFCGICIVMLVRRKKIVTVVFWYVLYKTGKNLGTIIGFFQKLYPFCDFFIELAETKTILLWICFDTVGIVSRTNVVSKGSLSKNLVPLLWVFQHRDIFIFQKKHI